MNNSIDLSLDYNLKKEKFVMLASSLLVLSALTLTGVYVKERTRIQNENSAELSRGDEEVEETTQENSSPVNVGTAVNPGVKEDALEGDYGSYQGYLGSEAENDLAQNEMVEETTEEVSSEETQETAFNQPALSFTAEEGLVWPVVGKVLINYSMDKTTYFSTLDQYKYSPAIVIGATEGETITAAATGKVVEIYEDEEIGNAVVMDLGGGYELTYGQLGDIKVSEGSYVETGDIIGSVATPTMYYSVEGANVYFALTKDGVPVNPMGKLK